ncbi:MAG TPA: peptidase C14 [Treponema sp.]|nr:MAG: peptidase C14 [Treponema sp. GWC1_61_84]OHE76589.1 MAG: peptidase C14 [Treponema sp. RIFOXYC1_FULL_61_9]HCM27441.1 peptidase C14 [Treponema sp.]
MACTSDSHEYDRLVKENPKSTKILAEGDSWFAYPRRYFAFGSASNIVDQLGKKKSYVIYSCASNGDEAVTMMSGEQKLSLMKRIAANPYDIMLFSGGGNDIVGRYDFDFFVKEKKPGMKVLDCVQEDRVARKLSQILAAYEELIERTMEFAENKNMMIITHTYDIAIPSDKGYLLFDIFPIGESWMYPLLLKRNIVAPADQQEIVREILTRFKTMLLGVQVKYPGQIIVVDTQNTLKPNHWRNEIHPTPQGFKIVSDLIAAKIDEVVRTKR